MQVKNFCFAINSKSGWMWGMVRRGKDVRFEGRGGNEERRSDCPVACLLDWVGDRWTLLVVRDLFLGRSRFGDFLKSPERIPTNLLSDRLERLERGGVVEVYVLEEGGKRRGYRLTEKGRALRPVLEAMRDWGLKWEEGTGVMSGTPVTGDSN